MISRKVLYILLGLVAAGVGASGADRNGIHIRFTKETQFTVTVSGRVTDEGTGGPITNALVRSHLIVCAYDGPERFDRCPQQETRTDAEGRYELVFTTPLTTAGPSAGRDTLCVYVSAPGYETQPRYVRPAVTPEKTDFADFDFALGAGKQVTGVVVDEAGLPITGAVVRIQNGLNGDWNHFGSMGRTVSAEDGSFALWCGPAGRDYQTADPWLCIHKQGVGTAFVWDILTTGELGTVPMLSGGRIAGKVVDGRGAAVGGCEVSVRGWPCGLIDRTTTDADGQYALSGVPGVPSIVEFYQRKNKRYDDRWGVVNVYARLDPEMNLNNAAQYKIKARDGEVVTGPDLAVGTNTSLSGRLVASDVPYGLGGLMVRVDRWDNMVEADLDGAFHFPAVAPGRHTVTAYLPHNLRYDRGIGRVTVDVQPGCPVTDVEIPLERLAELRVQYLDADGNPLEGITAGATWNPAGAGGWTEGTVSDEEGWAVLYLYPNEVQYVRGFDHSGERTLVAETGKEVRPEPGQIMDSMQIVMLPAATLTGRFVDGQDGPVSGQIVACVLDFADGTRYERRVETDSDGAFRVDWLTPGVVSLTVQMGSVIYEDLLGAPVELTPGACKDLGDLTLTNGFDMEETIERKHAQAMEHPEEVRQAAEQLFEKICGAEYRQFLGKPASWHQFPIVGYYMTHHWFDVLVQWMCETFSQNPIVKVELGDVFANEHEVHGYTGLPTVPYKVTLQDGTVLEGSLPFEYNFDGNVGHWHGLQGIDWHLEQRLEDPATAPR